LGLAWQQVGIRRMSDGDLVRQTLSGENRAYEELVRRWAARVLAVCHSRVGRRDIAEDLAQETLLRGFRSLGTLSDPEKFPGWLTGIAIRTCLDWLKAKERTQVSFSTLSANGQLDGILEHKTSSTAMNEDTEDLLAQVEALPQVYRETLMIYYYEDMTYQELATMLGVSVATINARLTKARKMLRERLERQTRS
jgi:RNA polymerase sigma-70 factor (ECF subfamily)